MITSIVRAIARRIARWMGLHPDVGRLIRGGFRLTNPTSAPSPSENLAFASRVIASGMWNYCFFQFYRQFAGPYWVERQYNPEDPSFIPRAGSMLSVNMTHRDWMGFRAPDGKFFSLVDPGGALSPIVGYYTIETAVRVGGRLLLPSRSELEIGQHPADDVGVPVTFLRCKQGVIRWTSAAGVDLLYSLVEYDFSEPAEIVIGIRPFNQEGAALIHSLKYNPEKQLVFMNGVPELKLLQKPDVVHFSTLERGDAYFSDGQVAESECPYGIGTGVLRYQVSGRGNISFLARTGEPQLSKEQQKSELRFLRDIAPGYTDGIVGPDPVGQAIDFVSGRRRRRKLAEKKAKRRMLDVVSGPVASEIQNLSGAWKARISQGAKFVCGRELWNEAARIFASHTLSLQKGDEVTPGVFTYHKFWFRDAAFMLHALSRWNYLSEAKAVLESYPRRQDKDGFFRSHEGEWDSNGQAIWSMVSHARLSGDKMFLASIYPSLRRGAEWILKKKKEGPGQRFLPPGFSAEHLGPADHYYWDNFWSVAGLETAVYAARVLGHWQDEQRYSTEAARYKTDILELSANDREALGVITAAPGRPVDAGMIGSVSVLYPLELDLFPEDQVRATVHTMYRDFFHKGLFFHPIIHSGYNIYLSLHIAQCMFALGDVRQARNIFKAALKRRTQLWTYPEAVHPFSGGGVMGDGFHGWAFAEMLLLLREFAVRLTNGRLHLFSGLRRRELYGADLHFGPFPLEGTHVTITGNMSKAGGRLRIELPHPVQSLAPVSEMFLHIPDFQAGKTRISVKGGEPDAGAGHLVIRRPAELIEVEYWNAN